jgi:hypothetical protein
MNKLAFLHFNIAIEMTQEEKTRGKEYLLDVVSTYSEKLFRQKVVVEIEIHDGSAKVWVVVTGAIYMAIGQYGDFRSGIDQIIEDGRLLHKLVYTDLRKCGLAEADFYESNKLTATPDKIRRLYLRVDRLEKMTIEDPLYEGELSSTKKYLEKILEDLEFKEDCVELLKSLDEKIHPNKNEFPYYGKRQYAIPRRADDFNGFFSSLNRKKLEGPNHR